MTKKILTVQEKLANILLEARTNRNSYLSGYQEYLTIFINNYDEALNKNSKPLFDFMKVLDNTEKTKVTMWLKSNTTLEKAVISDKGMKLVFKTGEDKFKIINDSLKWYDMKVEVKPFEPSEEKLKKSLVNLLKHYDKQAITNILRTL